MREFNSIEEKVIFEKLAEKHALKSENYLSNNIAGIYNSENSFNANKVLSYISEISGYINILENTRQNFAYRPIFSYRKFVGRIVVFWKKVIRKLLKFYIEPIAFQQTEFNNAVTPSIGRITEIQNELLNGIVSLINESNEIKESNEKLMKELEETKKHYNELEKNIISKFEEFKEHNEKLDEIIKIQEIANKQVKDNQQKLNKLDELDLDIFKEKRFNFWDKKTLSQSGEDAICAYINMAVGRSLEQCTYLDLGANHAKDLSNTYLFYSHGARGVLVEANPALIPELKFFRNEDIIINKCVSTKSGEYCDFYVLSGDGLSTPSLDSVNEFMGKNPELKIVDTIKVETISANDIIEDYFVNAPVIMNIDIEGKDLEILESINFEKHRPFIIIAEVIEYKTTLVVGNKNKKIIEFMERNNYIEYAFTGINSIFIDKTQIKEVL